MKKIVAVILAVLMITGIALAEGAPTLSGGWTPASDPAVTEEIRELFDKAMDGMVGVNYVPVAYLGSQVVAGMNYAILCQATVVYPNAQPEWVVVYLYKDLEGGVSILDIADFDIGSLCAYGADPTYEEDDHSYESFETPDGTEYDLFVITKMNYGPDHKVTSVTGHFERVIPEGEEGYPEPDIAPDSEKTYPLAEDFSADMVAGMFDDYAIIPVTDLYQWYIDAYIGHDDYDGHELVFTADLPENELDTAYADFWFVTTRIELNAQDEIQYMQYVYVPWA